MFASDDTIVAIATPPGRGGLGVVRISGPRAAAVVGALLDRAKPLEPRRATVARVVTRAGREIASIDQVVATSFPGPGSYTGEDVVEVCAHGSPVLLEQIVGLACRSGARLANPGEFTLRAFLHGRVDLVQAEAVADLVDAVTPLQARVAFDQLEGTITRRIADVDRELLDLTARLEASLDFPEEGYHFVEPVEVAEAIGKLRERVRELLAGADAGRLIREGCQVVVLGRPNVGKSSVFNQLLGSGRAIVTPVAGTTRDLVTETVDLDGVAVSLIDSAGIRATADPVEAEGVSRARQAIGAAAACLVVVDRSEPLVADDRAVLEETAASPRVVVVNKVDLPPAWPPAALTPVVDAAHRKSATGGLAAWPPASPVPVVDADPVEVSARTGEGIGRLPSLEAVVDAAHRTSTTGGSTASPVDADPVEVSARTGEGIDRLRGELRRVLVGEAGTRETPVVANSRHIELLERAESSLGAAAEAAGRRAAEEFVLEDLGRARAAFEELTGRRTPDDVLEHIFERFCIGK